MKFPLSDALHHLPGNDRPRHVGSVRHSQSIGLITLQPFPGPDPQIQLKFAVDPVNPFVIPGMAFDVAQMQEA